MNLSQFAPQSLLMKLIAWVLLITFIAGSLWGLAKHFENVGYDRRVNEEQLQLNKDLAQAAAKTQFLQTKLNEAQHELNLARQRITILTSTNNALAGKLRTSLALYNSNLSNDSRQTLEKRIQTLSTVVQECTDRYTALAGHADAIELDLDLFDKSYPKE
jgi:chromosome segregation ATPase